MRDGMRDGVKGGMSGFVRDTLIRTKRIEMEESVQLVKKHLPE